jgi:hypothetical protein
MKTMKRLLSLRPESKVRLRPLWLRKKSPFLEKESPKLTCGKKEKEK